jgi:hypothetical protein
MSVKLMLQAAELLVIVINLMAVLGRFSSIPVCIIVIWVSGAAHSMLLLLMDFVELTSSVRYKTTAFLESKEGIYFDLALEMMPFLFSTMLLNAEATYHDDHPESSSPTHVDKMLEDWTYIPSITLESVCVFQMCVFSATDLDTAIMLGYYSVVKLTYSIKEDLLPSVAVGALALLCFLCRIPSAWCKKKDSRIVAAGMLEGMMVIIGASPIFTLMLAGEVTGCKNSASTDIYDRWANGRLQAKINACSLSDSISHDQIRRFQQGKDLTLLLQIQGRNRSVVPADTLDQGSA